MRRILTTLFALVFVLTACGQNRFEKEMRSAKDNLLEGNYTEAKSSLEIALIEDPNNKDALALLEKAKQYILLEEKKKYVADSQKAYENLSKIASELNYPNIDYMEPADADMLLKKVNQVVAESKSLNDIWSSDKDTMDSADNLYQAAKSLFEVVALLKDNIHEEAKPANNGSSLQSKYDQVRASLLSNDSVVRAKREYETYLLITNEFEQSHSKLANIIENK